jgi:hypothetical protein
MSVSILHQSLMVKMELTGVGCRDCSGKGGIFPMVSNYDKHGDADKISLEFIGLS